jgi:hypothetical protein
MDSAVAPLRTHRWEITLFFSRVKKMFSPQDGTHGVLKITQEAGIAATTSSILQSQLAARFELSSSCTTVLN